MEKCTGEAGNSKCHRLARLAKSFRGPGWTQETSIQTETQVIRPGGGWWWLDCGCNGHAPKCSGTQEKGWGQLQVLGLCRSDGAIHQWLGGWEEVGSGWWGLWSGLSRAPAQGCWIWPERGGGGCHLEAVQGGPGFGEWAPPPSTPPWGLWDFQQLGSQPRGGGRPRSQQWVGVTGKEEGEGTGSCHESRADCTSGKALGGSRRNGRMAQLGSQEDVSQTLVRTDVRP